MAFNLPPPPNTASVNSPEFRNWFYRLSGYLSSAIATSWNVLTDIPANITAIANLSGTGYAKKTGTTTWILDSNAGGSGKVYEPILDSSGNFVMAGSPTDITVAWDGDYAS